jgi:two-component system sensor histidine kinase KdpD
MKYTHGIRRLLRSAIAIPFFAIVAIVAYQCHAKPLTAGLIDLALVMLIAFRWGFVEAAIASVGAVACLDFFYMPPIFSLYERDPQDWISSLIFATIGLLVSQFADRLRRQAIETANERARLEKLYLTSRDIIMMDRKQEAGAHLARLIEDLFKVDAVAIWDARELRMEKSGRAAVHDDEVRAIYFHELVENDPASCTFKRVLRLGVTSVGALYIAGPCHNDCLDSRSVDAIASLVAIALERAHSFIAESNAEAAKRSEQLRSTVLDGLAHAFKSPLATIHTASAGLLELPRLEATGKELATLIETEAERLTRLTDKVLQTAKLDEQQLDVDEEGIDLDELMRHFQDWFVPALGDHTLRLIRKDSADHVWADFYLLKMALLQLVDNAAKYAHPASPITLGIRSTDDEIVFSVHNEGSYVPPEERLRIFERFYRSPATQYKASGTGIGLSVTKRIAEAHRGRVWVESDAKASTTFFFSLPRIDGED